MKSNSEKKRRGMTPVPQERTGRRSSSRNKARVDVAPENDRKSILSPAPLSLPQSRVVDPALLLSMVSMSIFLLVALSWLSYTDLWHGCVLSASWCAGPGALSSPHEKYRRAVTLGFGLLAILPLLSQKRDVAGRLSLVFALICLSVPMSCGALEGDSWLYLGWNDPVHDASLAGSFLSLTVSYYRDESARRRLAPRFAAFAAAAVPALSLINFCPKLPLRSRAFVLALEVAAILAAHYLHAGLSAARAPAPGLLSKGRKQQR